jgi:hypothetical protein
MHHLRWDQQTRLLQLWVPVPVRDPVLVQVQVQKKMLQLLPFRILVLLLVEYRLHPFHRSQLRVILKEDMAFLVASRFQFLDRELNQILLDRSR